MTTDLLQIDSNERIDISDFQHLIEHGLQDNLSETTHLITDPAAAQSWILDGFEITNPAGKQVEVTRGRAILGYRDEGAVHYGAIVASGDASKIVDLTTFTPGTYGIYVRFEFVDGDFQSRIFWNPAGNGFEFAKTTPTRRTANWSVRVEVSNPGGEWLKIGEVAQATMVITDQRPFYFEGAVDSTYESGWSAEGGGVANDRNADRGTYGVGDFQTFTAAMRQCIEDVKGHGIRRWWDSNIGGMNIGFDGTVSENTLKVGDTDFGFWTDLGGPTLVFDDGDFVWFDRAVNQMNFTIGTIPEMRLGVDGLNIANGLYLGDIGGTVYDNDLIVDGGINVGFTANPTDDRIAIKDVGFFIWNNGSDSGITFDVGDVIYYDRATNSMYIDIGGSSEVLLTTAGLAVKKGLYVGDHTATPFDNDLVVEGGVNVGFTDDPVNDVVAVGDDNFKLHFSATTPRLEFESGSYLNYTRTTNTYRFYIDGDTKLLLDSVVLRPSSDGGMNLGTGNLKFGHAFVNGLTVADTISTRPGIYCVNASTAVVGTTFSEFMVNQTVANSGGVNTLWVESQSSHTTGTVANLRGLTGYASAGSVATTSSAIGVVGVARNTDSGILTEAISVAAGAIGNSGRGTVGTAYGLWVGDQTVGSTNYSIYTGLGAAWFGDQVYLADDQYFYLDIEGGNPRYLVDDEDSLYFNRTSNEFDFQVGGNTKLAVQGNNNRVVAKEVLVAQGSGIGLVSLVSHQAFWGVASYQNSLTALHSLADKKTFLIRNVHDTVGTPSGIQSIIFQLGAYDAATTEMAMYEAGLTVTNGLHVGSDSAARLFDDDLTVAGGIAVGYSSGNPNPASVYIGDGAFKIFHNGTDPWIEFDSDDTIQYDRSANTYFHSVAGNKRLAITSDRVVIAGTGASADISSGTYGALHVQMSAAGGTALACQNIGTGTEGPGMILIHNQGGAWNVAEASGDWLGTFQWYGALGSGGNHQGARIQARTTEAWGASAGGTQLRFSTTPAGTITTTDRWLIDDTGDLLPVQDGILNIGGASNKVNALYMEDHVLLNDGTASFGQNAGPITNSDWSFSAATPARLTVQVTGTGTRYAEICVQGSATTGYGMRYEGNDDDFVLARYTGVNWHSNMITINSSDNIGLGASALTYLESYNIVLADASPTNTYMVGIIDPRLDVSKRLMLWQGGPATPVDTYEVAVIADGDGTSHGSISLDLGGDVLYSNWSDSRLKISIESTGINGTTILKALPVKQFQKQLDPQRPAAALTSAGFIGQDIDAVFPQATSWRHHQVQGVETDEKYVSIDMIQLIPVLVKAFQELEARVTVLEAA